MRRFFLLIVFFFFGLALFGQEPKLMLPTGHTTLDKIYISPTGKLVATTGFKDKVVEVWDGNSGYLLSSLKDTSAFFGFSNIDFSNDDKRLITEDGSGIKIWNIATAGCSFTLNSDSLTDHTFLGNMLSANSNKIAAIFSDHIQIIDENEPKIVREIHEDGNTILRAQFSNDGKTIAVALKNEVRMYNTGTGLQLPFSTKKTGKLFFSPDDGKLLIASKDETILYNLKEGNTIFENDLANIQDAIFSSDNSTIVLHAQKLVGLYNLKDNIWKYLNMAKGIQRVLIDPLDKRLMVSPALATDSTRFFDIGTGRRLLSLPGNDSIYYTPDGGNIINIHEDEDTLSDNGVVTARVSIWDRNYKQELAHWESKADQIYYDPLKNKIINVTASEIQFRNILSGVIVGEVNYKGSTKFGYEMKINPNGKNLFYTGDPTYIWDTETLQLKGSSFFKGILVPNIKFSDDGSRAIISGNREGDGEIEWEIWDLIDSKLLMHGSRKSEDNHDIDTALNDIYTALNKDGKRAVVIIAKENSCELLLYNLKNSINPIKLKLKNPGIQSIIISPDDTFLLISYKNEGKQGGFSEIRYFKNLQIAKRISGIVLASIKEIFSPDRKKLLTVSNNYIKIWDVRTWQLIQSIYVGTQTTALFSPDGKKIVTDLMQIIDPLNNKSYISLETHADFDYKLMPELNSHSDPIRYSADGKKIYCVLRESSNSGINPYVYLWDAKTGKKVIEPSDLLARSYLSNDAGKILSGDWDEPYSMFISDLRLNKKIQLPDQVDRIQDAVFSKNDKYLYTSLYGLINQWDATNGKLIASCYAIDTTDYITTISSGYYMAAQNAAKLLHYVTKNLEVITFDQLDIKYNRPDKVLEAIGCPDTALIHAYRQAYEKRIKKLGIDTASFKNGYSVPKSDFLNRDQIEQQPEKKQDQLALHITGSDSTYTLDRFNVWVNQVPVYGIRGISLKNRNKTSLDTTVAIALSQGDNRIETSVTDANGTESYHIPLYVKYTPDKPVDTLLHFVGIGINKFGDKNYNLNWSVKDIRDLALKFKEKYKDKCTIDTLFDENVTIAKVTGLKGALLKSGVNDKVVLAYSGHGLLSKDYDYFLSTYNVNFKDPAKDGLPYDALESLLDSIPARKKLMLIDACHSGELDKDEMNRYTQTATDRKKNGVKDEGHKGAEIEVTQKLGMSMASSFELMKQLFVNVGKSTGATIISAAGGVQYALEKNDLKNGVFTYSILENMQLNPHVTISELKQYVNKRVTELTAGMQVPTTRNETDVVDWEVW